MTKHTSLSYTQSPGSSKSVWIGGDIGLWLVMQITHIGQIACIMFKNDRGETSAVPEHVTMTDSSTGEDIPSVHEMFHVQAFKEYCVLSHGKLLLTLVPTVQHDIVFDQ
nr:hypothetical protein TetV2_00606 [Oceanusvirus sp.]